MKFKIIIALLLIASPVFCQKKDSGNADEKKIDAIISKMTLREKAEMIGGYQGFDIRPLKRLGIPLVRMADGPAGVRNYGPSTAYPAAILITSSFDTDLMKKVGVSVGKEAKGKDVQIMLAPAMNIYRAPMCGRNFEYLGEDPFLAGKIASAYIQGVQSQDVMATAKHFAANNQEYDRHRVDSEVDERTLNEIYFPAFKASVQEGKVASVMNSYNPVNGIHASENDYLLNQVLKKMWGFKGFVMSDWGSTYDGINAANHGLDLEMPSGKFMNPELITESVQNGKIKEDVLNDKIRRILRMYFRFGFMDSTKIHQKYTPDLEAANNIAIEAARGGIVLLKNSRHILPLNMKKLKRIAVIGPNGDPVNAGGGGSGYVNPLNPVSYFEAVKQIAGCEVNFAPGVIQKISPAFFRNTVFEGDGAKGEFYKNKDLEGMPALTRSFKSINLSFARPLADGFENQNFSARFTGKIKPEKDGKYRIAVSGDDGFRLFIDGVKVIDKWEDHAELTDVYQTTLNAGQEYNIVLEYYQAGGDASIRFGYGPLTDGNPLDEAVKLAKNSDAVILCIGFNHETEGEGFDRPFSLPKEQVELLDAVAKVNKNTIVVLNAGGNAGIAEWIDKVPALIHSWYPGQSGAVALAEIIAGKTNPSGKLPVTFEKKWEDNPVYNSYYDDDKDLKVTYKEGIFVGYRGYEKNNVEPLFPFGYGLSYTTFSYSNIKLSSSKIKPGQKLTVTVDVKNTGKMAGKEIVELYLHDVEASLPRPYKELKGFAKVYLKPGETRQVKINIGKDELSFYNPAVHNWVAEPGAFEVLIGSSSKDIKLKKTFTLE